MARSPTTRPPVRRSGTNKPALAGKAGAKPPVAESKAAERPVERKPAERKATVKAAAATKAPVKESAAPAAAPERPKAVVPASPAPKASAASPAPAAPVVKAEPPAAEPVAPSTPVEVKAEPLVQPHKTAVKQVVEAKQEESVKMTDNVTDAEVMAKNAFTDVSEQARAAMEKGNKMIEEMNDFTKGNVEAFVAAGRAAAKGAEILGQNAAEYSRKSFDEASKALKTISSAKSPTEFFKLQNDFAKSQFDSLIAEASKVSEAVVKMFGDVAEPLSSRVAVAADKVKTTIR